MYCIILFGLYYDDAMSLTTLAVKLHIYARNRIGKCVYPNTRPVTSLGHQTGEEFSAEGPNFGSIACTKTTVIRIVLNYVQHTFSRGRILPTPPLVMGLTNTVCS